MGPMKFDHENLDVYKVSLEFVAFVARFALGLKGDLRNARVQILRSSQSIPLNIAEGNGKRSADERRRYLEIARGSAMESAATLDVIVVSGGCGKEDIVQGKELLLRIVAMLSRMTERTGELAREDDGEYVVYTDRDELDT